MDTPVNTSFINMFKKDAKMVCDVKNVLYFWGFNLIES